MSDFARNIKNRITNCLWLLVFSVFIISVAQSAHADDFSAELNISKSNYLIGDLASLRLIVRTPKGISYSLPDLRQYLDGAENIQVKNIDSTYSGLAIEIIDYSFTCFDNKSFSIPEISISYEKAGYSSPFIYKCPGLSINFALLAVDTSKGFKDIYGEIPLGNSNNWFSIWYVIFVVMIILVFIIWRIIRNIRKVQKSKCPQKELLKKLDKLKKLKLDPNKLAVNVADLSKEFIVVFYHLKAFELSTDETLKALNKIVNSTQSSRIKMVLGLADRVKFGKYAAEEHDSNTSLEMCREFALAIIRENSNA